jgi:hypothetical protein
MMKHAIAPMACTAIDTGSIDQARDRFLPGGRTTSHRNSAGIGLSFDVRPLTS